MQEIRIIFSDPEVIEDNEFVENKIEEPKIKATYYIGFREKEMLTEMYIEQLKKFGRGDKSAMVCEAIRLLYKHENNLN